MSKQDNREHVDTLNPETIESQSERNPEQDSANNDATFETPQVIPMGPAVDLVQGFTWGDGPDGYTGYYKYH